MKIYDKAGRLVTLDPTLQIGDGGEAYVYRVGAAAAKIYRRPDDPFYAGPEDSQKFARAGAKRRLQVIQEKLRAFPHGLPPDVITPQDLLFADQTQQEIAGYLMPLIAGAVKMKDLGKVQGRPPGLDNNGVLRIFSHLHGTLTGLHPSGVVIGDFNALNVLVIVAQYIAKLIDADSMQFGKWFCEAFTNDYVDPLICDPNDKSLRQVKPHSVQTDWYAWGTMLFESLTYLHPYLGAYEPADPRKRVPREMRPLHRVTWFNPKFPGTKVPRFAIPFARFSDEWAQYWEDLFHKDIRVPCSPKLLAGTKWVKCSKCGSDHCRPRCPQCQEAAPVPQVAVKETIRGNVRVTKVFNTAGLILNATVQDGKLRFLYSVNGEFKREEGNVVFNGMPQTSMRFAVSGPKTIIGMNNAMFVFDPNVPGHKRITVDAFRGGRPSFVTNGSHYYWAAQGMLFRDEGAGTKPLGQVLENQTLLWVGSQFGVGFYQAGGMQMTLVFDVENPGINDRVELPFIRGQILEMRCYFSKSKAWLLAATQDQGRTINRCFVLDREGKVWATAEAEAGDNSWLGSIDGKIAVDLPGKTDKFFAAFAAKDTGLVRVHVEGSDIAEKAQFPDTEGFVDSSDELLPGPDGGIYVVSREEIRLLQIR